MTAATRKPTPAQRRILERMAGGDVVSWQGFQRVFMSNSQRIHDGTWMVLRRNAWIDTDMRITAAGRAALEGAA